MGEKDIIDKGLEDNESLKEANKNGGVASKKSADDVDESGMPEPEPPYPPPEESSAAQKKSISTAQIQSHAQVRSA